MGETACDDARRADFDAAITRLRQLREEMRQLEADMLGAHSEIEPAFHDSAANLLHYLVLRRHDLRAFQDVLARLGLSSLGRAESHVMAAIEATLATAQVASYVPPIEATATISFDRGETLLSANTERLLGPAPLSRSTRIMVTMPREASEDYELVRDLLAKGMDCMRINCAHDDAGVWRTIIDHLRRAEQELSRSCRVLMDLGGPKLRTGPLPPGPNVIKVRPQRDAYGRVTRAARLWLTPVNAPAPPPQDVDATVPLQRGWLDGLKVNTQIRLRDARDASRSWTVTESIGRGFIATTTKTNYLQPGIELRRSRAGHGDEVTHIGPLPPQEGVIVLQRGDLLVLSPDPQAGRFAVLDEQNRVAEPPVVGCTLPEALEHLQPGQPVWLDDGKIGGTVERMVEGRAHIRITRAEKGRAKLRSDKGINLPRTELNIPALTEKDRADLSFVAAHADMVGLSFVNSVDDVLAIQAQLAHGDASPALVLKIETQRAFERLPALLLAAMRRHPCGVMIARGDLAVECGFERLAEVQEELLWLSEAAHIPVIWATQVLDNLAKTGIPSRAEITDAAMSHRAECVMLNKGPHINDAVMVLDDILQRMGGHQVKKTPRLRALHLARDFGAACVPTVRAIPGE